MWLDFLDFPIDIWWAPQDCKYMENKQTNRHLYCTYLQYEDHVHYQMLVPHYDRKISSYCFVAQIFT